MSRQVRHYPSASTTTWYVNQYLIDDIYRVDFQRKTNDQPIWGYASKKFDFVARGRELVTGNIVINFRYPGYLKNLLTLQRASDEQMANKIAQAQQGSEMMADLDMPPNMFLDNIYDLDHVDDVDTTDSRMSTIMGAVLSHQQNAQVMHGGGTATSSFGISTPTTPAGETNAAFLALKKALYTRHLRNRGSTTEEDVEVSSMESPLDDYHPFNMRVRYGFQGVPGGFERVFKEIYLIGEGQTIQVSGTPGLGGDVSNGGQPILEVYPFFCKTISVSKYHG